MTYTYKKSFGKYDSSTNFEGDVLTIEYVHSSVSEDIKVVQMWRDGLDDFGNPAKGMRHELAWMSEKVREKLLDELRADMTDRMCKTGDYLRKN